MQAVSYISTQAFKVYRLDSAQRGRTWEAVCLLTGVVGAGRTKKDAISSCQRAVDVYDCDWLRRKGV